MHLSNSLTIDHVFYDKHIEIFEGDLTEPRLGDMVDVLVVSAFKNDYTPTETSVIGALARKGLSIRELASRKEYDHRRDFACWLSESIEQSHPGLQAKRILCFEPAAKDPNPANVVDDIFRALAPFVGAAPHVTSIAMPLVACGDQNMPVEAMLDPLLKAAEWWMRTSTLNLVRIVEKSPEKAERMRECFADFKARVQRSQIQADKKFDVFLSYSRVNTPTANIVVDTLRAMHPSIRIFRDSEQLTTGRDYRAELDRSLRGSRRMVALYSPDYLKSDPCKEEFTSAFNISDRGHPDILFPIMAHHVELVDTRMLGRQYEDGVEADPAKIRNACSKLIRQLA